jgi:hypothetical protein
MQKQQLQRGHLLPCQDLVGNLLSRMDINDKMLEGENPEGSLEDI